MHRNEVSVFTKLQRIEDIAKQNADVKFTSLAHLLNPELLQYALSSLNKHGAPGVDKKTVKEFEDNSKENIEELHRELKEQKYRATNIRRAYIPKNNGKLRPLGIPTVKDRIAQRAMAEILTRIYEPQFMDISYGFRPKRSAHDALAKIREQVHDNPVQWVVDVDIKGYFDHVNHEWMIKFLEHRIVDRSILRILSKWLHAGILDNGIVVRNEEGVPQGGPVSPILANIYLHYVLDLWFEKIYKRQRRGYAFMVRYADDFVVGFEYKEEAEQFLRDLKERFAKFSLQIAEEKTQIVAFGRKSSEIGKIGPGNTPRTFTFLGFIHYMMPRCEGSKRQSTVARKPKRESRNKFLKSIKQWLWDNMHTSVHWQRKKLTEKLRGYYNYFGLPYCRKALQHVKWHAERIWICTLRRRSQKHHLWWSNIRNKSWFKLPTPA